MAALSPEIIELVNKAVAGTNIPAELILAQIRQESGGNANARSYAGAVGISQFIPSTARAYGLQVGNGVDDRLDPVKSIVAQVKYMDDLIRQYGSFERALSAYNSGKPNAYLDPNFSKGQTYNYVKNIMGSYQGARNTPTPVATASPKPAMAPIQNLMNRFTPSVAKAYSPVSQTPVNQYTVRAGDTLSGIAKQYLGNANAYNQLSGYRSGNPNLIFPGEVIKW